MFHTIYDLSTDQTTQVPFTDAERAEFEAAKAAALAEKAQTRYKTQREKEYPPITDYIDGVVKGDQAQVQSYIDACLAVKTKYPKPDAP